MMLCLAGLRLFFLSSGFFKALFLFYGIAEIHMHGGENFIVCGMSELQEPPLDRFWD